jgi:hypothetical protein
VRKLILLVLALAIASPAGAAEYEIFVDIDDEEDLYELLADGQISEDTLNALIEMLRRGIDLNRATREELYMLPNLSYAEVDSILKYREQAGFIEDPAALVTTGALSERKLRAIAAFLVVRGPEQAATAVDGYVRGGSTWAAGTDDPPPGGVQVRVGVDDYSFGVASVVTQHRIGEVAYDPARMALSAEPEAARVHIPKFFALYDNGKFAAIAGTYRIGFGQRLTFDNTDRYTPQGFYLDDALYRGTALTRTCKESAGELPVSPCSGDARYEYGTPDYRWRDGLRGFAVGTPRLDAGPGWLSTFGFVSYNTRSIYQYEIYDKATCDDVRDDDDTGCSAPQVFRRGDDVLEPSTRFSYHTLPDMFAETIVGGNVSYYKNRRAHIGVTGYGADIHWLTDGIDLDFQEWSAYPYGGGFGAVGVDGQWGSGRTDIYLEVARSFDSMPDDDARDIGGGGGLGALLRTTATFPKSEVETSLRYYQREFANPYARPIAAADEFEGLRARDEAGARIRYTGMIDDKLQVRSQADLWVEASDGSAPEALLYWRADYAQSRRWRYGLWTQYQNKNLKENGHGECFSVTDEFDETGEAVPCAGQKYQVTGRVRWQPRRKLNLSAQYQHEWLDETGERFDDQFRQDISAWAILGMYPADDVRVRARVRYLFEDIESNTSFEQSLWSYIDVAWRYSKDYRLRARYDLILWLDDRDSTNARDPSPESWFFLEAEARF